MKREQKEQEAERKKGEKAAEKAKNDAFKKDLRKGNQAGIYFLHELKSTDPL